MSTRHSWLVGTGGLVVGERLQITLCNTRTLSLNRCACESQDPRSASTVHIPKTKQKTKKKKKVGGGGQVISEDQLPENEEDAILRSTVAV